MIPEMSAAQLRTFQAVLACGLIIAVWVAPVAPVSSAEQRHVAAIDLAIVHRLASSASAILGLRLTASVAAVLFGAGIMPRLAYAGFVGSFLLLTLVALESRGVHDLGLPLVTFLGWLAVPWCRRRDAQDDRVAHHSMSTHFGFAIWWPGLTLGLALLAAAWAKLSRSGLAWVTGGAIKYYFVMDNGAAPVDWGLRIAGNESLAILLSLGAVVLETVFILVVFTTTPVIRLMAGLSAAVLFLCLYLFQGVLWTSWHILLLAFLPWAGLASPPRAIRTTRLSVGQAFVVAIALIAQLYASAVAVEREPFLSNFPMYSSTFASTQDFDRNTDYAFTNVRAASGDGRDHLPLFEGLGKDDGIALVRMSEATAPAPINDSRVGLAQLTHVCQAYRLRSGQLPASLTLVVERGGFDWSRGQFRSRAQVATRTVPLRAWCAELGAAYPRG